MVMTEKMKRKRIFKVNSKIRNKEKLTSSELQQVAFLPFSENLKVISDLYGCNNCPYGAYGSLKDSGRCKFDGAHSNNMCHMRYQEVLSNLKAKGGSLQELYDLHMIAKYFHFKQTTELNKEDRLPGKSWWNNQAQVFSQGKQIHEAVEGKKLKVERDASPADIARLIHKAKQGDMSVVEEVKTELEEIEDDSRDNNQTRQIANTA